MTAVRTTPAVSVLDQVIGVAYADCAGRQEVTGDQTPDTLPVLQSAADPAGLVIAMGFSGHGFCLGPATGQIAAAMPQDLPVGLPLASFALARFDRWNAPGKPITLHG